MWSGSCTRYEEYPEVSGDGNGFDLQCAACVEKYPPPVCLECGKEPDDCECE